eukprot:SAG31_NODE_4154_length_3527_cov_1.938156_3_plen_146_part_00
MCIENGFAQIPVPWRWLGPEGPQEGQGRPQRARRRPRRARRRCSRAPAPQQGDSGCLNTPLGNLHSHALNALGNCSTPTDWLWPPAWDHDKDCSLMQYCGYPSNWTTMHNVCKYDHSCAEVGGGSAAVGPCNGSSSQRFAFIAAH